MKILKHSLLFIPTLLLSANMVMALNCAGQGPVTDTDEAEQCVQNHLVGAGNEAAAYQLLHAKNALGDVAHCKGDAPRGTSSFFDEGIVQHSGVVVNHVGCQADGRDAFQCNLDLRDSACFVTRSGTMKESNKAIVKVGKFSRTFFKFHPVSPQ